MNKYHFEFRPWRLGDNQVKSGGMIIEAETIGDAMAQAGRQIPMEWAAMSFTVEKTNV